MVALRVQYRGRGAQMKPTKTRDKKRLLLNKEKVRDLTKTDLDKVVGGTDGTYCSFTSATRRDDGDQ